MNIETAFMILIILTVAFLGLIVFAFVGFTIFRWRGREEVSIDSALLMVRVPRNNEVKIDAMDQLFASILRLFFYNWNHSI